MDFFLSPHNIDHFYEFDFVCQSVKLGFSIHFISYFTFSMVHLVSFQLVGNILLSQAQCWSRVCVKSISTTSIFDNFSFFCMYYFNGIIFNSVKWTHMMSSSFQISTHNRAFTQSFSYFALKKNFTHIRRSIADSNLLITIIINWLCYVVFEISLIWH